MLHFKDARKIFLSYVELKEKKMSGERYSYVFPQSLQRGKELAREIVCNQDGSCNGYVHARYMMPEIQQKYSKQTDERLMIKIKTFTSDQLREVIEDAIHSMNHRTLPNITKNQQDITTTITKVIPLEQNQSQSSFKLLVRSCLYNWLGYGNPNGYVWFIGTEEGGAEIWRHGTKTLEQSLQLRSRFRLHMDFVEVWENHYDLPLSTFRGGNVWNYIAAFLLSLERKSATPSSIHDFVFVQKKLGRSQSEHYLCELYPLPKPSKNKIEPYQEIWHSVHQYQNEVSQKRFELIWENLIEHSNVRLMVCYERDLMKWIKLNLDNSIIHLKDWNYQNQKYQLYQIQLTPERMIFLLSTPFFGQGQISYAGIADCVEKVREFIS